MITKEEFEMEFGGHGTAFSTFMLIDVTEDQVIDTLNAINNPEYLIGSGSVIESEPEYGDHTAVRFEISGALPDFLHDLTKELHCRGFADMGSWYGDIWWEVSRDGGDDLSFVNACWEDGYPEPYIPWGDEEKYDATFIIQDKESGISFVSGEGCVDKDTVDRIQTFINECGRDLDYTHIR